MNIFSRFVIASGVARARIREHVLESAGDYGGDEKPDMIAVDVIRPKEAEQGFELLAITDFSPYCSTLGRGNESRLKKCD